MSNFNPNNLVFLIMCFFPGYLSLRFAENRVTFPRRSDFDKATMSGAMGFAIFSAALLLQTALGNFFHPDSPALLSILLSWALILPTGIIWTIVQSSACFTKLFQKLGISERKGLGDPWGDVLSKTDPNFVTVHLDNGTTYAGWVDLYSDIPPHEIVINPTEMVHSNGSKYSSFNQDDKVYIRSDHIASLESLSTKLEQEA